MLLGCSDFAVVSFCPLSLLNRRPPLNNFSIPSGFLISVRPSLTLQRSPHPRSPTLLRQVCDIQGNLQDGSQVVVSLIFENKCDSFLKAMEFNVLDSLNSKLQRPEGAGPHDGLTVPFQLPPGQSAVAAHTGTYRPPYRRWVTFSVGIYGGAPVPAPILILSTEEGS